MDSFLHAEISMCIYEYIYIYTYTHTYTYVYEYAHTHTHVYVEHLSAVVASVRKDLKGVTLRFLPGCRCGWRRTLAAPCRDVRS